MIEYYTRTIKGELKKTEEFIKGCWINVINPNEEEIEFLLNKFNLKKEDITDGLDIHESPRFEIEDSKIYIFLSVPTEKILQEDMSSFLVVHSKNYLITISKHSLEVFEQIIERYQKLKMFSSSRNLVRILFFISKAFDTSVHKIIREIRLNKKDLNKLDNKDIAKLIDYENRLNNYISAFGEIIQNYNKILRTNLIKFPQKDEAKLEDLINDLNETFKLCKSTLRTITNMRDYYSTKLSTDLNKTVTVLTTFTIFLTIPILFASIYGMNVSLPLQNSPNILLILGGITISIWVLMFFVLRYLKLI